MTQSKHVIGCTARIGVQLLQWQSAGAEHEAIDRTWKIATGSPRGPFEIYDIVGLGTAYHISLAGGPKQQAFARLLKERYIDHGKLGVETGEGFYRYES